MEIGLVLFIVVTAAAIGLLMWSIQRVNNKDPSKPQSNASDSNNNRLDPYNLQAAQAVKTVFNDEFREELRNRGRLHFEKIINENAMFLQEDLRLTTAQLNDYMKQEITRTLQEEFTKYEQSITDAKQLALDSMNKTQILIEEQRKTLGEEVKQQLSKDKDILITKFEQNMADIINHYVLQAIGDQIDLSEQLDFILNDLETNKQAIIEDIKDGA